MVIRKYGFVLLPFCVPCQYATLECSIQLQKYCYFVIHAINCLIEYAVFAILCLVNAAVFAENLSPKFRVVDYVFLVVLCG